MLERYYKVSGRMKLRLVNERKVRKKLYYKDLFFIWFLKLIEIIKICWENLVLLMMVEVIYKFSFVFLINCC